MDGGRNSRGRGLVTGCSSVGWRRCGVLLDCSLVAGQQAFSVNVMDGALSWEHTQHQVLVAAPHHSDEVSLQRFTELVEIHFIVFLFI